MGPSVIRNTSESKPRKRGSLERAGETLNRRPSPSVPVIWTYVFKAIVPGRGVMVGAGVGEVGAGLEVTKRGVDVDAGIMVNADAGKEELGLKKRGLSKKM